MAAIFLSIGDGAPVQHPASARFAHCRGLALRYRDKIDTAGAERPAMISIGLARLERASTDEKQCLARMVEAGAVLYVRGIRPARGVFDLAPFASGTVLIEPERVFTGYRFTAGTLLPAALRSEEDAASVIRASAVHLLPPRAQSLIMLRESGGRQSSALFAIGFGDGNVVYDLQSDQEPAGADLEEIPLVERLADPHTRFQEAGALIAADCAVRRDSGARPAFNLTIDDRPANFDHFNAGGLRAFLSHLEEQFPGAHTDFAWTPRNTKPSREYLGIAKQFSTGFVWHGLYRHVDHRVIRDPAKELARGRRLVNDIERRFGVRLQRIMIFPFERTAAPQFKLLMEAGFVACVEEPRRPPSFDPQVPSYLERSLPSFIDGLFGFNVLNRYRVPALTRDRMLAMAALGLPIIAYAHPDEIGLRRFSRLWDRKGEVSHFDPILHFAAAKGLPSRSLEEIASEVTSRDAAG